MEQKLKIKCELGERGQLTIDMLELIHELPDEQKIELAESLCAGEYIIESVCAQIVDGFTPRYGFWGSWSTGYDEPLQRARQLLAKSVEGLQKAQIEELEGRLERAQKEAAEYSKKYFELYHANLDRAAF